LGVRVSGYEVFRFKEGSLFSWSGFLRRVIHPLHVPDIDVRLYVNLNADSDPFLVSVNNLFDDEVALVYYFISSTISRLWNRPVKSCRRIHRFIQARLIDYVIKRVEKNGLFLAICKYTAGKFEEACGIRPKILYGSINGSTYKWRGEKKEDYIVSMGRLDPYKRYEYAILAAKAIQKKLIILGAPCNEEYCNMLIRLIRRIGVNDRVNVLVGLSSEERASILKRAKVFLHCSVEGFSKAVAEAMAAGCIPVVPRTGGQSEYTPQEFQYSSFDEMLQKIEEAFNSSQGVPQYLSEKAMFFDLPRYKTRFINLLREEQLI